MQFGERAEFLNETLNCVGSLTAAARCFSISSAAAVLWIGLILSKSTFEE
jgi:hypothetical protein